MFVAMCPTCDLRLTLISKKFPGRKISGQSYRHAGWTEIKFIRSVKENEVFLAISTKNYGDGKGYWAVDKIRPCRRNEFRMISTISNENLGCELINHMQQDISVIAEMTSKVNTCPEHTFSRFCIPCGIVFFPTCDRLKICENYDNQKSCSCSSGYQNTKFDCSLPCSQGMYGHDCRKKCTLCENYSCSSIDGFCRNSRSENYEGTNCTSQLIKAGFSIICVSSIVPLLIIIVFVVYWKRQFLLANCPNHRPENVETIQETIHMTDTVNREERVIPHKTENLETENQSHSSTSNVHEGAVSHESTESLKTESQVHSLTNHTKTNRVGRPIGTERSILTPLHVASLKGHFNTVHMLIESGADVNMVNSINQTSLHLACWEGHVEVAELLIKHGACINAVDRGIWTPLTLACHHGHTPVVQLLIDNGVNVNLRTSKWRPLGISCYKGFIDIARLLIEAGEDVNEVNTNGITALHWTAWNGHLEIANFLLDIGAEINAVTKENDTPLHWEAQNGHIETVQLLLNRGAKTNITNVKGMSPLNLACVNGHISITTMIINHIKQNVNDDLVNVNLM